LLGSRVFVFTDHATLKYLLKKAEAKTQLIRWMFWLQEFDLDIRDRSGAHNLIANHLNRIESAESLLTVSVSYLTPWFANIVNFLVAYVFPPLASRA